MGFLKKYSNPFVFSDLKNNPVIRPSKVCDPSRPHPEMSSTGLLFLDQISKRFNVFPEVSKALGETQKILPD